MQRSTRAGAVLVLAALSVLAGCKIQEHGNDKDVSIATPFGGMQIKTDDAAVPDQIGLPVYPGATISKDNDNHGSADVNMNFGSLQMRVEAVSYRTTDDAAKVESFYREGLKRYGGVIACRGDQPVGSPVETSDGLTCTDKGKHVQVQDEWRKGTLELKAGSKEHQHIVAVDTVNGATKFALVMLDLPPMLVDGGSGPDRQ